MKKITGIFNVFFVKLEKTLKNRELCEKIVEKNYFFIIFKKKNANLKKNVKKNILSKDR